MSIQDHLTGLVEFLKEVHSALAEDYRAFGQRAESRWLSLDEKRRAIIIGHATKIKPLEGIYIDRIFPDWNLNKLVSSPDYLLTLIKHRATTSLLDQYTTGPEEGPGNFRRVIDVIPRSNSRGGYVNLQPPYACEHEYDYVMFGSHTKYARLVTSKGAALKKLISATTKPGIQAQFIAPQDVGGYILTRQLNLMLKLHGALEEVWEIEKHGTEPFEIYRQCHYSTQKLVTSLGVKNVSAIRDS